MLLALVDQETYDYQDPTHSIILETESEWVPSAGDLGWARLQRSIRQDARRETLARVWKPALAMAAGLALVVQGALLYQADDGRAGLAGREDAQVQITFAPDAREADLRALLQEVGATIVDGPSASGVYRLVVDEW